MLNAASVESAPANIVYMLMDDVSVRKLVMLRARESIHSQALINEGSLVVMASS